MAKTTAVKTETVVEEKKTRKVLTPAERIEKAKADLAALEAKEETKAKAKVVALNADIAKLESKRDELNTKITALTEERDALTKVNVVSIVADEV